jgi:tetratricopeptide (TPR) repeat protein
MAEVSPTTETGLLAELRRRGVVRAVVAYAVVAFAVLQVSEPILHALKLPDSWLTVLVALLGLGFPLTAALSWAFDLTRRGIVRTPEAPVVGPTGPTGSAGPAGPTGATGSGGPAGSSGAGGARSPRLAMAGVTVIAAGLGALLSWLALRPPAPVVDADGRVSVAVADFANETRDPDLDGLSVLLTTALEQSKALRVVTRGALADALRRLGQGSLDRIDEGLARKAGVEAGVRALLLASVRKLDDVYAVELRAVDPRKDEYLFTVREQTTGKKGMLEVIDRLSERTRERLREPAREVAAGQVKVAEATTASLEAWHHYFEGLKEEDAVHLTSAIEAYRKAVAADPTFALANYKVAFLGLQVSVPLAERKAAMEAAVRGKDRVPLKERLLIEAWAAFVAGRSEEAHAIYARAAEAFPTDKEVLYATGTLYHTEMRWPEARPWLEKVVALDPRFWPALDELSSILFVHGTREAYLALIRRYLAVAPPSPKASLALAIERGLSGRLDEAAEATRRVLEQDQSPYFIESAIGSLFFLGLLDEAEQRLRKLEVEAALPASRAAASFGLVIALDLQGRRREALALVEKSGRRPQQRAGFLYHFLMDDPDPRPCVEAGREFVRLSEANGEPPAWRSWVAFGMAYLGQLEEAARIAAHLKPEDGLELYRAIATWRGGDLAGALSRLRALDRDMDTPKRIVVSWYHARVAFEAGQWAEAIAAGEEAEPKVWGTWRSWGVPLLLLERAQAWERLGQREKAIAAVDRLLGWWKKADPDLPRLAQARAIKARLVAAGPAAPAGSAGPAAGGRP